MIGLPGTVLGDLVAERLQLGGEQLGVGRLDPGGEESASVTEEGDVVGGLVGVDADVEDLAVVEADRGGRRADDAGLLGRCHGRDLRKGTSGSVAQVCLPNGYGLHAIFPSGFRLPLSRHVG